MGARRKIKTRPTFPEVDLPETGQNVSPVCPYLHCPMEECYCRTFGSRNIPLIVNLCGENFEECAYYRRMARGETAASAARRTEANAGD